MRNSLGKLCVIAGVLLLLAALSVFGYNRREDAHAGAEAQAAVQELEEKVMELSTAETPSDTADPDSEEPQSSELPVILLDGYEYIGVLSIPSLDLRLPVMSDWSYPKLKLSPCRASGSSRTDDMVIAAHNYELHFGKLGSLSVGDSVEFTDMEGVENHYTVTKTDVLKPTDVDEVKASGYALTLYTCTYGGKTRIVVFCQRAENGTAGEIT